ncbi:MAG: hypothetical protein F4Y40_04390 [Acidimicrobiia bacterium]|nr:hypothetical protein [Acidimicrobiia bacterium]
MAGTRITFALDRWLVDQARRRDIDIPSAAGAGVRAAIRDALVESDRTAYERMPEEPDAFWTGAQVWG